MCDIHSVIVSCCELPVCMLCVAASCLSADVRCLCAAVCCSHHCCRVVIITVVCSHRCRRVIVITVVVLQSSLSLFLPAPPQPPNAFPNEREPMYIPLYVSIHTPACWKSSAALERAQERRGTRLGDSCACRGCLWCVIYICVCM